MSVVAGVELGTSRLRVVLVDDVRGAVRATSEVPWDPARPEAAVARLREQLERPSRIGLSVGLGLLHVKQVHLPPVPAAERRHIVALEPDRFFAVRDEPLVVALAGGDAEGGAERVDVAVAGDRAAIERWVAAFDAWAPVSGIESAPTSLARAAGRHVPNGAYAVDAGAGEQGVIELADGRARAARRAPAGAVTPLPLRPARGVAPEWLLALGAAGAEDAPPAARLAPPGLEARIVTRRRWRVARAALVLAASLAFAVWSADRGRARHLAAVEAELAEAMRDGETALALNDQLTALDRERAIVAGVRRARPAPLEVLGALSARLPADAVVLRVHAAGDAWQVDGSAADGAAVVRALEGDGRFTDVRFLQASTRFSDAGRMRESFSVGFRAAPSQ